MDQAIVRPLPGSGTASNLASSTTFGPIPVRGRQLSIIAAWTGTPTGTFDLQCSVDGATWASVPGASAEFTSNSQSQPAGSAGSAIWTWFGVPGGSVRLSYTATGGTGTLTASVSQV